jgi:hypothetical protein
MTVFRLLVCLAALASALVANGFAASAASDRDLMGGVPLARAGLPLDPQLLPPNTAPGDCVTRRVTGPGGAYRWDRIECETRGPQGFDSWGPGHRPLEVETPSWPAPLQAHQPQDRYGPPRNAFTDYRYAGKDADGFLVWPGKQP